MLTLPTDEPPPDWPLAAHSRFVEAAGVRWHVQRLGAGPVLLLLHGTGAATHSWRGLAPLLAEQFDVVAVDLPGHGFTTRRPAGGLTLPAMARAVAAVLGAVGMAPRVVVGHSAGAAVAIRMAVDGAIAPGAVVGVGSALLPFPGMAGRLFPSLARLLFVNPLAPRLFARIARTPGETRRFLERSTGSRIDQAGVEAYARLFGRADHCAGAIGMMADWDLASLARDLPRLETPLLLIHGDRDLSVPLASARDAAARVPGAKLEVLRGLGHLAHEERPNVVAGMIATFARDHAIVTP